MTARTSRQQRSGKSYLHGVLRDGATAYRFRHGGQRLLQSNTGFGMRVARGNGFMPVNFKYLHGQAYLQQDYGMDYPASRFPLPDTHHQSGVLQTETPVSDLNGTDMRSSQNTQLPSESGYGTVYRQSQSVMPETGQNAAATGDVTVPPVINSSTRPAVEINIPDDDGERQITGKRSAELRHAEPKSVDSDYLHIPDGTSGYTSDRTSGHISDKTAVDQPALLNRLPRGDKGVRMPPNLTAGRLAEMLERSNFGESGIKRQHTDKSDSAGQRQNNNSIATTVKPEGERSSFVSSPRTRKSDMRHDASIKPGTVKMPPVSNVTKAGGTESAETKQNALRTTREAQNRVRPAAGRPFRSIAPAAGMESDTQTGLSPPKPKTVTVNRVTVVHDNGVSAFWERSYLPRMSLRVLR